MSNWASLQEKQSAKLSAGSARATLTTATTTRKQQQCVCNTPFTHVVCCSRVATTGSADLGPCGAPLCVGVDKNAYRHRYYSTYSMYKRTSVICCLHIDTGHLIVPTNNWTLCLRQMLHCISTIRFVIVKSSVIMCGYSDYKQFQETLLM